MPAWFACRSLASLGRLLGGKWGGNPSAKPDPVFSPAGVWAAVEFWGPLVQRGFVSRAPTTGF